jgi:hypothetical protein
MKYAHVISNNAYGTSARSNEVVFSIGQGTTSSNSVGPGQWLVRTQIAPGRYFGSPASGCYWERQKGLSGSLSDVLANEFVGFNALQWIVDIMPTDLAFETDSDCGTWSTTPRPAPSGIPPGVWLVGAQIQPDTYSVNAGPGCYWERLRDFTGNLSGVIDNEFVSAGGPQLVTIAPSDVGFHSDADCGIWTRINAATALSGVAPTDIQLKWLMHDQHRSALTPRPLIKQ